MEAVNGKFSGQITATSGSIGGFTIAADRIYSSSLNLQSDGLIEFGSYLRLYRSGANAQIQALNGGVDIDADELAYGRNAVVFTVDDYGTYIDNTIYSCLPALAVSYTANVRQNTDSPYDWYRPTSSRIYKKNIEDMPDELLETLLGVRVVQWNTLDDSIPEKQYGLIAEEVYEVNPLFCAYGMNDGVLEFYEVHYGQFIPLLIRYAQMADARIRKLEEQYGVA
jgi:hypothetical protein